MRGRLLDAHREVPAPAARQAPRPGGPGGPGPAALPRPDRQRTDARDVLRTRGARRHSLRDVAARPRGYLEVETPMLQPRARRGQRPPVHHPHATPTTCACTCASPPSCTSSGCAWAASSGCSSSAGTSATRASSFNHNPEFTMLEAYQAYADYTTCSSSTRELIAGGHRGARRAGGRWPVGRRTVRGRPRRRRGRSSRCTRRSRTRSGRRSRRHAGRAAAPAVRAGRRAGRPGLDAGAAVVLELYERLVEHATPGARRSTATSRPTCRR